MEKLTLEDVYRNTRVLWAWLAENPEKMKEAWPGWWAVGRIPVAYCWACDYDVQQAHQFMEEATCSHCPLLELWPIDCLMPPSPYLKWQSTEDLKTRREAAQAIVDFCDKKLAEIGK